jgi:hypothetical protein
MMPVFWDVALCSTEGTDECLRGAYCLLHCPDNGGSKHSEKLVYIYHTTYCNIPEDSHLRIKRHENLTPHISHEFDTSFVNEKKYRFWVLENKVLRIFALYRNEIREKWRKLYRTAHISVLIMNC